MARRRKGRREIRPSETPPVGQHVNVRVGEEALHRIEDTEEVLTQEGWFSSGDPQRLRRGVHQADRLDVDRQQVGIVPVYRWL